MSETITPANQNLPHSEWELRHELHESARLRAYCWRRMKKEARLVAEYRERRRTAKTDRGKAMWGLSQQNHQVAFNMYAGYLKFWRARRDATLEEINQRRREEQEAQKEPVPPDVFGLRAARLGSAG